MTIHQIELCLDNRPIPEPIRKIIQSGWELTQSFQDQTRANPITGFHSSDFEETYRWLVTLKTTFKNIKSPTFCEWGSGLAIVSLLAEKTGFQVTAIESEPKLYEASIKFHKRQSSNCRCLLGSFIPSLLFESNQMEKPQSGHSMWLDLDREDIYESAEPTAGSYDVIYAYPWPGESGFIFDLFDNLAKPNAFLLTFHGATEYQLHQKA